MDLGNMGQTFLDQLPGIGGVFDDSRQQAMQQMFANQALYGNLQMPNLEQFNPEKYSVVGQYDPTMMKATTVSQDPSLYNTQLAALNNIAGLAQTGESAVDAQQMEQARELGAQTMNSGNSAALQNAAARGMSGSGTELAMREAANQAGAQQAMQGGLAAAANQAQMRAMYNQMMSGTAQALQAQQTGLSATNANIMNQINALNTQTANQAQQYNLGNAQRVANANVSNANYAHQYNNTQQQQLYNDQLQKLGGETGANQGVAGTYGAINADNQQGRNDNTQLLGKILGAVAGS